MTAWRLRARALLATCAFAAAHAIPLPHPAVAQPLAFRGRRSHCAASAAQPRAPTPALTYAVPLHFAPSLFQCFHLLTLCFHLLLNCRPSGPLSAEDVESKAKSNFAEFLSVGDTKEAVACVRVSTWEGGCVCVGGWGCGPGPVGDAAAGCGMHARVS